MNFAYLHDKNESVSGGLGQETSIWSSQQLETSLNLCLKQISCKHNEKSSPRLRAHLYKHPADATLQRTTALFKAEKVRLRSKVVVIRLLLAVCGGDGGGSGGSDGGMSTGFWEALARMAVQASLWQPVKRPHSSRQRSRPVSYSSAFPTTYTVKEKWRVKAVLSGLTPLGHWGVLWLPSITRWVHS